jgi:hypothetical protein
MCAERLEKSCECLSYGSVIASDVKVPENVQRVSDIDYRRAEDVAIERPHRIKVASF